ncbi:MAG: cytochrome c-type biogenesis protein [Spongiibacteraceae bacterium]|jgi:cytochrome c-type biogenesis protein CcmH
MKYLTLLLVLLSTSASAVIETYDFENDILRTRYNTFIAELRCPKCQNQNLEGSNSPIAKDLRRELYRMLEDGQSDQQIVDYMVNRYGDFILYRPRFNPETALLWMAPGVFLILGMGMAVMVYRRQKKPAFADDKQELNVSERKQLEQLLSSKENTNA